MPRITTNDFPPRLTLMEAVAWIATREPVVLLRASLDETRHRKAMAILAAADELYWCGNEIGISLLAIDQRCGRLSAAEEAAHELVAALAGGKVVAKVSYFTPTGGWGPACQLPQAEWDSIVLYSATDNDRKLVPFIRTDECSIALTPVTEWRVIGIEIESVLACWPALPGQGGPGTGTMSPHVACLTIEDCIARVKETLGYPDGPAGSVVLNALRGAAFLAWEARPSGNRWFQPCEWYSSSFVPAFIDVHGQGYIAVGGVAWHPRKIVVAEHEFIFWLKQQTHKEPPEDKPWPKVTPENTWANPVEPEPLWEAGENQPAPRPNITRNKTGPRPAKRESIVTRMVAEYAQRPEALAAEKVVLLTNTYRVSKDTVTKARVEALTELRKNPGITPE